MMKRKILQTATTVLFVLAVFLLFRPDTKKSVIVIDHHTEQPEIPRVIASNNSTSWSLFTDNDYRLDFYYPPGGTVTLLSEGYPQDVNLPRLYRIEGEFMAVDIQIGKRVPGRSLHEWVKATNDSLQRPLPDSMIHISESVTENESGLLIDIFGNQSYLFGSESFIANLAFTPSSLEESLTQKNKFLNSLHLR